MFLKLFWKCPGIVLGNVLGLPLECFRKMFGIVLEWFSNVVELSYKHFGYVPDMKSYADSPQLLRNSNVPA